MKRIFIAFLFLLPIVSYANHWEFLDDWILQEENVVYLKDKGNHKFLFSGYNSGGEFLMVASCPQIIPIDRIMKLDIQTHIYEGDTTARIFISFFDSDYRFISKHRVHLAGKITSSMPFNELILIRYFSWSFE